MKRFALLTFTAAMLLLPVSALAAKTDGVPLMPVRDMKVLPGTVVPITPPVPPKPCAPLAKGQLNELPGQMVPVEAPRPRR
jgi:hypothetical protein